MNERFFPELARRLRQEGIDTCPVTGNRLPVLVNGQEAIWIHPWGMISINAEVVNEPEVNYTCDITERISAQVYEYTEAMAIAPRLAARDLKEDFRLLASFNDVVLAGQELERDWGYKFVTWLRTADRTGVVQGNYYHNDFAGAKLDFACRAGLVQESRQFSDGQLVEMYRCIHETLDTDSPMTRERSKTLMEAVERIESSVDSLEQCVEQSIQRELEAGQQADGGPGWRMSP